MLDPVDTANHYALEVSFWPESTNPNIPSPITHYWDLPGREPWDVLEQGYQAISDEGFDGQAASIHFETTLLGGLGQFTFTVDELRRGYFVLRLLSLNEPAYRFGTELSAHRGSRTFPFLTSSLMDQLPQPMYSNAEGGFGVFMGQTVRVDTLRL